MEDVKNQEEVKEESNESPEIDYKAELERVKVEKEKLEEVARRQAGALREERKLRKQEPEGDEDVVAKVVTELDKRRIAEDIDATLESLVENEDERELVRHVYETSIKSTGSSRSAIRRDLENARLLANRAKFVAQAEKKVKQEIAEKKAIEDTSHKINSDPTEEPSNTEYNTREKAFLRRYGVKV
jgi:hypothetical protein